MFVSSLQPLRLPQPTPAPRLKKSKFAEAVHDIWHSVFNWTLLMLIITPRPDVRRINKLRQRPSAANSKPGLLSHLSRLFSTARRVFLSMVKGASVTLRSLFTFRPKTQPPIIPRHVPHSTRVDTPSESPATASLTIHSAASASDHEIQTPVRAVSPTNHVPNLELPAPLKTSPTTAQFLATLTDLEAQMNNHILYDLERELEDMDNQMSHMFDFPWMPRKTTTPIRTLTPSPPPSPIPMILPQAPPPARRDGRTIEILPMICEVSESSAELGRTPPYDPRRWSIATFQPLWGPRTQVGAVY
ncbi:unnamed protein product [Rhizoctonia solani]|uniref:Uncharacterized protein n=1 Tax=Rhizoctonia solani TaxID=456999 RepID=A0A8H3DJU7_9AGAM|nr:unnamed protein product [Rhizoctonia solani]